MAIYHLAMKPISRSSGRSAVAAAAYRSGARLTNERDGQTHDFTTRAGVVHSEIVLPAGSASEWARDRSKLWNAVEAAERRKDARVAREFEVALPHELTGEERLALTQAFAQDLADRYGGAVDFAIHEPGGAGDVRNHHAHLLMTTRAVMESGLGEKTLIERENKALRAQGQPSAQEQLQAIRIGWEELANAHLVRAGLDVRIDHRSHTERGVEIEPTEHQGVHASQIERRGGAVSRRRIDEAAAARNASLIRERPAALLDILTDEKSVFERRDIARALHRYVDDAQEFQNLLAAVMTSPELVELRAEKSDESGKVVSAARYSTREMIDVEATMADAADRMVAAGSFQVAERHVEAALAARPFLAEEQRQAVRHITGGARISAVVGLAGAGKSTMLAAAHEAWEKVGHRVHGAALAGKAAEGLEESSGITSRTLASWERSWANGTSKLMRGDVLVIDEAGMVGSRALARFVVEAGRQGAKLVLVGDPEQLQPIQAGAAFRAIAERIGFASRQESRRQREEWQRDATRAFASHRTAEGLDAYHRAGAIHFEENDKAARGAIVRDILADMVERPDGSRIVLAHRRADVQALNEAIRAARQARGELAGEVIFETNDGPRAFAAGDRLVLLENNRDLRVKNGMLATVDRVEEGQIIARIDGRKEAIRVPVAAYAALDYGYATTVHKSQGATVDRCFALASNTLDLHLTYVAFSRHRDQVRLYASRDEFNNIADLTRRLSRSAGKETTLDYAERRGMPRPLESKMVMERQTMPAHTAVDAVARGRARLVELARGAYADGNQVADELTRELTRDGADFVKLEHQLRNMPEIFGSIRGRSGLLGENEERRIARRGIGELASEVVKVGRMIIRERAQAIDTETHVTVETSATGARAQEREGLDWSR